MRFLFPVRMVRLRSLLLLVLLGGSGHRRLRPEGVRGEKNDDDDVAEMSPSSDVVRSADTEVLSRFETLFVRTLIASV